MSTPARAVRLSFVLVLILATHLQSAEKPVSIGFNANWEHALTRSANVGWTRMDIGWWDVNPQQGVWDFSGTDGRIAEAEANGQKILAILHLVPAWAGGGPRGNIPPLTTSGWSEFVRRLAQRYSGRIAAYEIWNEPDASSHSSFGIGWDRNIEEPPLYIDFARAAAMEIRAYSPGNVVVGPAYTSRADSSSKQNRRRRIFEQIRDSFYPNGSGPSFIDVVSFHNNGHDTTSSRSTAWELRNDSLNYLSRYCYPLLYNPVWVTEYGWRSNAVGESGQREKICNITKIYSGRLEKGIVDSFDIRAAFIYVQKLDASSQSMFRADYSAKPTVTQYLRALAYPATQSPATSSEYPSCAGVATFSSDAFASSAAGVPSDGFAALGLGDPAEALPDEYTVEYFERGDNGSVVVGYNNSLMDDPVRISASRVAGGGTVPEAGRLSEGGASWLSGAVRIDVVRPMSEGKVAGLVSAVAAALDPAFSSRCMLKSSPAGAATIQRLGVRVPVAPGGFGKSRAVLHVNQATPGCGARAEDLGDFDLMWNFEDTSGAVIRAGTYRYGDGFAGDVVNPASLHWSSGRGIRYWVAVEAPVITEELRASMWEVARSMNPGLALGQ